MTEQGKKNDQDSTEQNSEERLKEIIKEEQEDASSYYSQDKAEEGGVSAQEISQPVAEVDNEKEEMNFLKTVAFLGFGLAALAIIFILFFIRDLDDRVVSMDNTVAKLDEKIEPFKKEVNENIEKVNANVAKLEGKVNNYERMVAIMELKRALVTIQEVTSDAGSEVKSKSSHVLASIQSLLQELTGEGQAPAAEAPPTAEPPAAEPAAQEPLVEGKVEQAPAAEGEPATGEPEHDVSADAAGNGGLVEEEAPETNVGEIQLTEEGEDAEALEELEPSADEESHEE
ncbi:MAG: hypothetical protein ACE5GQ_09200 [Nitrospinales bacterium]